MQNLGSGEDPNQIQLRPPQHPVASPGSTVAPPGHTRVPDLVPPAGWREKSGCNPLPAPHELALFPAPAGPGAGFPAIVMYGTFFFF